ncbi:MAG: hypothetical protein IE887_04300 [Campylobacterales bacterium]|nr:hypothetical protein [Campylobacterales bacterium]
MVGVKILLTALLLMLVAGCGGDNSLTNDGTKGAQTNNAVEVNGTKTLAFSGGSTQTLTTNGETISIEVLGFDTDSKPLLSGTVKVAYPSKATTGVDVGSFAAYAVDISNGKAVFQYTAPKDLQARVDAGDTSTTFGFYLESDSTVSTSFTVTYSPTVNQIIVKSYKLTQNLSTGSVYSMPLESTINTSFTVKDDSGIALDDADISLMTIRLLNPVLADIQDNTGTVADTLSFTSNGDTISLISYKKSGIVPIEVNATFSDVNGKEQNLSEIFNMTILSGPPTAMSVSYKGSRLDSNISKFVDTMVVSITDKYFNPVNTQPAVTAYLVAGYTRENTSDITTRLFIEPSDAKAGTMDPVNNSMTTTANLTNIDLANDFLLTFANGYTYNISGKWDISSVVGNEIFLEDTVESAASVSNVGFALGHNYRQDTCRSSVGEQIGNVIMGDSKFSTNGSVEVEIYYDFYLAGKDVTLGVDTVGYTAGSATTSKFGEAVKHTLRSTGISPTNSCSIPSGATNYPCTIEVQLDGTVEYLRNAHVVGYLNPTTTDGVTATYVSSLNDDINDCTASNGRAYVTYSVDNTSGQAGSVSLTDLVIAHEF